MIICVWLPQFALRVSVPRQGDLVRPLALVSTLDAHPVVRCCTSAAQQHGVASGMLVSRALGCCAQLEVLACDDELVARSALQFVVRLESTGAAVEPVAPGRAHFDAAPLMRMHGGLAGVLAAVRRVFRTSQLRLGVGPNPFVAWVAARHAAAGGHVAIDADEAARVLAGMPISLLPMDLRMSQLLDALGVYTLGAFAAIGVDHVADRFGEAGVALHALSRGIDTSVVQPRLPEDPIEESLPFPEPVGNVDVLQRALRVLVERAVAHPRCVQHAPRSIVVACQLVRDAHASRGASHHARRALRVPTVDVDRIVLAARTVFDDVPAPIEVLTVRLEQFELRESSQGALFGERGTSLTGGDASTMLDGVSDPRVQAGLRHVQAVVGDDALLQVLEVQPGSRVPERHVVLVPRGDGGGGAA